MTYRPAASVTAVRCCSINTGLVAVTVTPGNTAPVASFTIPAIPASCACAAPARRTRVVTTAAAIRAVPARAMGPPLAFLTAGRYSIEISDVNGSSPAGVRRVRRLRDLEVGAVAFARGAFARMLARHPIFFVLSGFRGEFADARDWSRNIEDMPPGRSVMKRCAHALVLLVFLGR